MSARPSVGPWVTHELKPCQSAVFDQNYYQYEHLMAVYPALFPSLPEEEISVGMNEHESLFSF